MSIALPSHQFKKIDEHLKYLAKKMMTKYPIQTEHINICEKI